MSAEHNEHSPLLNRHSQQPQEEEHAHVSDIIPTHIHEQDISERDREAQHLRIRRLVTGPLLFILLFVMGALVIFVGGQDLRSKWLLRGKPQTAARRILSNWPLIDGHIDLPILYRQYYANNISAVNLYEPTRGHVDIPRLRDGKVGGFWWSTYVACPPQNPNDPFFLQPSWRVRDTLEQIDIAKLVIEQYPDTFQLATTADQGKEAIQNGKIASWIGVEGGHQLGNSLAVLRRYYDLGVRYVTLTHLCHNAFADSGGWLEPLEPLHYGLSELGNILIAEMNRLGMIVDLSHTSDQTALQALTVSRAPVMWSHSSSRAVWNVSRNVPNEILSRLGTTKDKHDGVVMVNFSPDFVGGDNDSTVKKVADHIEEIARVAGKRHVGIGSDFDGITSTPVGLEDVSKYPNLIAVLIKRGWKAHELQGLVGGNFFRIMEGVERVAREMRYERVQPRMELYDKRPDLPWRGRDL